ncbi:MAG: tRNA uridine-5-carboxymethylaminomethyl(34) synthesis GTPase MnmE [Pseudomonadales bacterium]|nr:tRNA uridine-5-carboxymethylaminomethyl(34) synthesis GTPase MnmE [Pseudomonadales bacterium]
METLLNSDTDTIVAIATPPGRGGIGVIRVSGPASSSIAKTILGFLPEPRKSRYGSFYDTHKNVLDEGIALYFEGPSSFTGEDVLELQGHGGPVVLDMIVQQLVQLGCRMARPGEFSERAFLNNKINLTQAEAIADLIDSSTQQAARSALASLQGVFSNLIDELIEQLVDLRCYLEASIDFPDEDLDLLANDKISPRIKSIQTQLDSTLKQAKQGSLLKDGIQVVIIGKPNAGKSSLLNCLAGSSRAIVTDIAGTTRDLLEEQINIDGLPINFIDTAGLRDPKDAVEQEGINRALKRLETADCVLLLEDATQQEHQVLEQKYRQQLPENIPIIRLINKIDLTGAQAGKATTDPEKPVIRISAKQNLGIDQLKQYLKEVVGFNNTSESAFTARRRHLESLAQTQQILQNALAQWTVIGAAELLAEDLRGAQKCLEVITGSFSNEDLLDVVFSGFCIGK